MIIGLGIDIVDTTRVDSLLRKFGDHFLNKIYTPSEIQFCRSRVDMSNSLAKMFAIKEAAIKALSDAKGIRWHDIEIHHDCYGKPLLGLSGVALKNISSKSKAYSINVSVSDEKKYAAAVVVIETNE